MSNTEIVKILSILVHPRSIIEQISCSQQYSFSDFSDGKAGVPFY